MTRLHTEWQRLTGDDPARILVVELTGPAPWTALAPLWRGVQADWGLPAPAIAVNGRDGVQLWFLLAQPLAADQRAAFAQALLARYVVPLPRQRVACDPAESGGACLPAGDPAAPASPRRVPCPHPETGHWSAFVAPDLAPLFDDEPWLDLAPGDDAQADLLMRLTPTPAADLVRVHESLRPKAQPANPPPARPAPALRTMPAPAAAAGAPGAPAGPYTDPRDFLLAVMNDPGVPLPQRIDAARALLAAPGHPSTPAAVPPQSPQKLSLR